MLEPATRNTGPAITLTSYACVPDALLLVMTSDHVIADVSAFYAAIKKAVPLVQDAWLAIFGITPATPETGYAIFAVARRSPRASRSSTASWRSPIKPPPRYLASDRYSWNGGIFLFTAAAYIAALEADAPDIAAAAKEAIDKADHQDRRLLPDSVAFGRSLDDSIDYAVMEKAPRVPSSPSRWAGPMSAPGMRCTRSRSRTVPAMRIMARWSRSTPATA